ncbi:MAG: hypothetical protein ACRDRL_18455, partial [Sciscionella sp.]
MDMREARRAAEKLAREKVSQRVKIVGELGVLAKRRDQAEAGVDAARIHANSMVEAAQVAGDKLVEVARDKQRKIEEQYQNAYGTALSAGWNVGDLEGIGLSAIDVEAGE